MMWAALVLWVSPREHPFIPWKNTSVSRCSVASKRSWGMQSGGLAGSMEAKRGVTKQGYGVRRC